MQTLPRGDVCVFLEDESDLRELRWENRDWQPETTGNLKLQIGEAGPDRRSASGNGPTVQVSAEQGTLQGVSQ